VSPKDVIAARDATRDPRDGAADDATDGATDDDVALDLTAPGAGDEPNATASRILDAALVCVARVGVSKTTLDDVARTAGCSRATVYRYFPGKQPLLTALVDREAVVLADALCATAAGAPTLSDAVVALVVGAAGAFERHDALRFVLDVEPEVLLPYLTFEAADEFLARVSELVAPALEPFLGRDRAPRGAEWLARLVLSYLCSPSDSVDLTDEASVRSLVDDFVVPGLVPSATTLRG